MVAVFSGAATGAGRTGSSCSPIEVRAVIMHSRGLAEVHEAPLRRLLSGADPLAANTEIQSHVWLALDRQ